LLKPDFLKSLETDLKAQLAIDKKYLPIQKKMAALLRDISPFMIDIEAHQKAIKEEFLQASIQIHKSYAENMDSYQKSLKLIIDKNTSEIDKAHKERVLQTQKLSQDLKSILEDLEKQVNDVSLDAANELEKADQQYKRELTSSHKLMTEARKTYQKVSSDIEREKELALKQISLSYDQKTLKLDEAMKRYEETYQLKLEKVRETHQSLVKEQDETYLTIKNTYTELSISLNKKINEVKKKHQALLKALDQAHEKQLKPHLAQIEKLKQDFQDAQDKSLVSYQEKLTSLNVIFDVQKQNYESKKERIIHEGNEQITLLNSKLSSFKESIQRDKMATSREKRDEIKSIEDEHLKDKKTRDLTYALKDLDQELNKQIIRTNKDIIEKKKDAQKKLYQLDMQHLKEINEWRLKKTLYEYEKKQEFAKIELNFNHNMSRSEATLKQMEATYQSNKEILLLKHNQDLLPLEYQLQVAQAIQERELNLLANDAQLSLSSFRLEEKKLEIDLDILKSQNLFELEQAKTLYAADVQVLNTNTTLELEKEKVKRDYVQNEQELRIELSQSIFNKQKALIEYNKNEAIKHIEMEREIHYIEHRTKLEMIKGKAHVEELKRTFIMNEARYKHQQRLSNEKAHRLLRIYENELELNQVQTEDFMFLVRMGHQKLNAFKKCILELYHLPSHPEVLKGVIGILKQYLESFKGLSLNILEHFQALNQDIYLSKIEDLTGYKYMLKHENEMNFYGQEIGKIVEKKKQIEEEIKALESAFFQHQSELERNQAFLNQLAKISDSLKKKDLPSEHRHQDIKENQKLMHHHIQEIKQIKQMILKVEKEMDEKHKKMLPYDDEMTSLKNKQNQKEKELESKKKDEASIFYAFLNKNQAIYEHLSHIIKEDYQASDSFYRALLDEVYLTDLTLSQATKKLDQKISIIDEKLMHTQQRFLNLMLTFYQNHEREQDKLVQDFKFSTFALIKSLNQNYLSQEKKYLKDERKMKFDSERLIKNQRIKFKRKHLIDHMSYQKGLNAQLEFIRVLEKKISETEGKGLAELKLINENQIAIANQYQQEYLHKVKLMQDSEQKKILELKNLNEQSIKNHESLEHNLEAKNQMILNKYQANYDKHMNQLKQKTLSYDEQIEKLKAHDLSKQKALEESLSRQETKRKDELTNIQSHMERFQAQTKRAQNHELKKELRLLKKTHYSKVRMLHLN